MTDHAIFLRAILAGDLGAALPYSDWLQERGDARGVLLRRRAVRWRADREWAVASDRDDVEIALLQLDDLRRVVEVNGGTFTAEVTVNSGEAERLDRSFAAYVALKFAAEIRRAAGAPPQPLPRPPSASP